MNIMVKTILLLYMLVHYQTSAQIINVSGKVTTNEKPVADCIITFTDNNDTVRYFSTTTDVTGNYNIDIVTPVYEETNNIPIRVEVDQNYPNPFSNQTTFAYRLPSISDVEVKIFNILGQEIKRISIANQQAGLHRVFWDGRDKSGAPIVSGIYFYQVQTGGGAHIIKMLYLADFPPTHNSIVSSNDKFSHFRKADIYAGSFRLNIESTDSTEPLVVRQQLENVILAHDTIINITAEEARIIPGCCIDGVMFGDDSLTVVTKLGKPDTIHGNDFNGIIMEYTRPQNPHSIMALHISFDTYLGLGVIYWEVQTPYKGSTKDGIRTGTCRDTALYYLGKPTSTDSTGSLIEDHYFYPPPQNFEMISFMFEYSKIDCTLFRIRGYAAK